MANPPKLYWITLVVWATAVAVDAALHVNRAMELLPTDEVYADSIGFQLIAFALTRGAYWLVAILIVLVTEMAIFSRRGKPAG